MNQGACRKFPQSQYFIIKLDFDSENALKTIDLFFNFLFFSRINPVILIVGKTKKKHVLQGEVVFVILCCYVRTPQRLR